MVDDPSTERPEDLRELGVKERVRMVVMAGYTDDHAVVEAARGDTDPHVRVARLGALARVDRLSLGELTTALGDPHPRVRRRAVVLAVRLKGPRSRSTLFDLLIERLSDLDPLVAESAAWALGERRVARALDALGAMATEHRDARCRESAVAALGAIGHRAGLAAVLSALRDRPPIRRRAVVALAGFEGLEVEEALRSCLDDPDWQVRQAAEILLEP